MDRQKELRNLLRSRKSSKPLPSKLCGYNNKFQLICKICKTTIQSTTFWKIHEKTTKHKQTVNRLLKLKEERDSKLTTEAKSDNDDNNNNNNNNNELASNETETKTSEPKQEDPSAENKEKQEVLIDGLPSSFFDKSMEYKRPKKKRKVVASDDGNTQNTSVDHFVVIPSDKNEDDSNHTHIEKDAHSTMDDTEKELFKLEKEMKIEQTKKEDELLEFMKEIDKKMGNEENKELQFKMDHLKEYRNKFTMYHKKRKLKQCLQEEEVIQSDNRNKHSPHDSDSEFDVNDIFDLGDWRTQKI